MKQSEKQHRFPIFCDRLCELQGKKTIAAFAAFLGLSRPTVNFYLNGDRVPDALTLRQIAERCNVSSDWLLGLSDVKDPDGTLQQVCRYTGLNAQSVQFLHNNIAWRDEDGRYRGGFSEDEYNPKRLLDDLFRLEASDTLFHSLYMFCSGLNIFAECVQEDLVSDAHEEMIIDKINQEYGQYGIVGVPMRHIAFNAPSDIKLDFATFIDRIWEDYIFSSERSDPDAPQE